MKHLLLFCTFLFSLQSFGQGSLEGDRLALVALYNSTDGPNWLMKAGWTVAGPVGSSPCSWYGVTCESGRVTSLDLSKSALNGNIPPEIGNLAKLKSLTVGWNSIAGEDPSYGPIPTEIGNLTNLEHLDLSGNTGRIDFRYGAMPITGPIPSSIGNLTKLTYLDLSYLPEDEGFDPYGSITGSIPAQLGNLVNLTYLNLSRQRLTGSIPTSFNNLTKLNTLNLSNNKLGGTIPNLLGIPVSAVVNISFNKFTFAGLETNAGRIDYYGNQAKIQINVFVPLRVSDMGGDMTVFVGGTYPNNTYRWFLNNVLIKSNNTGYYRTEYLGTYRMEVTNSIATGLTLISEDYEVTFIPPMPVELVSFSGNNEQDRNILSWKTASENDNSGFFIEKSADAISFQQIGFVDGSGDSKENKIYTFTDSDPLPITYYRLKQIDYDGKFEYSRTIAVKQDRSGISIYPNPAADQLFVKDIEKEENVIIRNLEGKVILEQKVLPKSPVNVSSFSSGLYTITIGGETRKVVIQR